MIIYQLIISYQVLMVMLSILGGYVVIRQKRHEFSKWFLTTEFCVVLINLGYLLMLISGDVDQMMYGARVKYCGEAFVMTALMAFVFEYCHERVPSWIWAILLGWDTAMLLCLWNYETIPLFYNGVECVDGPYFSYLVHGNGILYKLNGVVILLQTAACITTAWQSFRRSPEGKFKTRCLYLFSIIFLAVPVFVISLNGSIPGFDPAPGMEAVFSIILTVTIILGKNYENPVVAHASIIRKLKEPVIIADAEYRFVEANDRALEVFPKLRDHQPGDEISDELLLYTFRTKQDGEIISDEFILHADVQKIVADGEVQGYAMLLFDLTQERMQLEEMQRLKVEADMANQAKSDFLAKMSHEIRTPINAVLGMDEMILRESRNEDVRKYASDIKSAAKSLLSIINEILDSSKIESGKMEIVPANYEMGSMINDLYNMISGKAREKDLDLHFEIDEALPSEYYGDDVRIRQIVVNILNNAVKYTMEGCVTLTLTGDRDGDYEILHFAVKDTGIGIRKEDISKLFSEYVRIDLSRNRYVEGTGLGISITRQLLQMMGSSLQVESEYGKGSVFYFDLRQKIVNEEPIGDFTSKIRQQEAGEYYAAAYRAPEARVLLVDDNEMNRKVFRNLLRQTQMQSWDVGSGKECLDIVSSQKFDLIFLDHMMPEMDGIETFHAMKKLENNLCAGVPVVMLTANAVTGAKERYMSEGFDDFLTKPIMPDKLDEMVLKYLPGELVEKVNPLEVNLSGADSVEESNGNAPDEKVDLPELEEFDFEYAMRLLRNKSLLKETLLDFYHSMPGMVNKLEIYVDTLEQKESLNAYRIEVHALKSTAATVGALLLSKLARMLEVAAKEKDLDKIRVLHPILMEEIEKHKKRMAALEPQKAKEQLSDMSDVLPLFEMLRQSLEQSDYNTSDYLVEKINAYAYPEKVQELVEQLCEQVLNLEDEDAVETIDQIMNRGEDI